MTFHRGHWCPYCQINTRALAEAQAQTLGRCLYGGDRARAATIRNDVQVQGRMRYPVLTDIEW